VLSVLRDCGMDAVELTMTTPGASDALREIKVRDEGIVGMGSVTSGGDARKVIDAGADFIVSPVLDDEVVRVCVEAGVPVIPGTLTPTEMARASALGATAIKVFPAGSLGPTYIAQVLAALPELELIATGGIEIDQVRSYLDAGASAVGVGGPLIGDAWKGGDLEALAARCRRLLEVAAP
jgi:2-dehydro-3-deoxyphosphogluconate aldolase / (4S)-4-hydroxy-2-oxoglutarate aldolase